MGITWLGQGGFALETDNTKLIIDPFLSDIVEKVQGLKRLIDPPVLVEELKPDFIFITHNHLDHFDPIAMPQIHEMYPEVPILGPQSVVEKAKELNFRASVLSQVEVSQTVKAGDFLITVTPAYHSDPYGVGCLLKVDDLTIYLTSDTVLNDELIRSIEELTPEGIQIFITCINGKFGNMTWQDAARFAQILRPDYAIPMHYGMFAENTENPQYFINECQKAGIKSPELVPGITKYF
jgi:L-ascorbate metabolism protein UlaG (beta-lactamase superfamily)